MVDHSQMALGKKPAIFHPKTLKLAKYYRSIPNPPTEQDWYSKIVYWPMMLNDKINCCAISSVGHAIQQWTTYAQAPFVMSDNLIVESYSALTGYDPNNPTNDPGTHEIDALSHWKQKGWNLGLQAPDVLTGFAQLDHSDLNELKNSICWFGNAYIGLMLPKSGQTQDIWDVPSVGLSGDGKVGSWGGHACLATGYDADYVYLVTWNMLKKATWDFIRAYMDEAYALISRDWLDTTGISPNHLKLDDLLNDLDSIN